jgi:hypothetical protein
MDSRQGAHIVDRSAPHRAASADSVRAGQARDRPIVAIGELLWDELPGGSYLGGAPFVATHMRRLGWPAALSSAVGADQAGDRAMAEWRPHEQRARLDGGTPPVRLRDARLTPG